MAVALIQEFRIQNGDRSTTNYDAINERLTAGEPPAGGIIHTAGFDDEAGVFRIFEVWESREQCERFLREQVMPVVQELAGDQAAQPDRQAIYDLHNYVMG
jgi:hypothetical protein